MINTSSSDDLAKRRQPKSLRTLILLAACISVAICLAIILGIFLRNMTKMLEQAEREHMEELSHTIKSSVTMSFENLHSVTRVWACWDDPYYYALGENDGFIDENFGDGVMLSLYGADFVLIQDLNGETLYEESRSELGGVSEAGVSPELSEKITEIGRDVLADYDPSLPLDEVAGPYNDTGFAVAGGQAYVVCVMPILPTDETGEAVGVFAFAQRFGNDQLKQLTSLDNTEFAVFESQNEDDYNGYFSREANSIFAGVYMPNLTSDRGAGLVLEHPRTLYTNGRALMMTTLLLLIAAILAVMAAIILIVRRVLIQPLTRLIGDLDETGANSAIDTGGYGQYLEMMTLSGAINDMLQRLNQSYRESEATSVSLNVLKNILNGMDAYLYVSDPETDEILFINDFMRAHFGLGDDTVGQTCWRMLQDGFEARCDFCPCHKLAVDPGTPVIWEEHNTVTQRYYKNTDTLIDWIGGKKVHLQHSVDITDLKKAQFALDRRLRQQLLMTTISQSFISNDYTQELITSALKMTGEFLDASQALYYQLESGGDSLLCISEWISPTLGISSTAGMKITLTGAVKELIRNLQPESEFVLRSSDPVTRSILSPLRRNFKDVFFCIPVFVNGKAAGAIDFSRPDGDEEWNESDLYLAVLVSNILSGLLEKRAMEDQLKRLSAIVQTSPQLILDMDTAGRLIYVNPAAEMITGYDVETLLNGGLDTIFDEETADALRAEHIPTTVANGTDSFEITLTRADGRRRVMAFSTFATHTDSASVGAIASDVTEVRELESALIAAKDLAELGSKSKTEFLSRMSHEMRTPMNAIIGMTNIAKGTDDMERKQYCLDRIENASRHLLGVINDILDMSKIEANKFELSSAPFNFEKMLLNVLDVINFKIDEKSQNFALYLDPAMPCEIIGDEQHLAQVITNLLTNAVKFTPEKGNVRLSADVESIQGDEVTLKICVTDSGIGISQEQQKRLFTSFEQADGSIARKFGGTGLGLAISKQIVELMGGRIWVESELDTGSSFFFTLMVKKGRDAVNSELKKRVDTASFRVLAVDDSKDVCDYFIHMMSSAGIPCDVAMSGEEALDLCEMPENSYDIMFIDWKMPGMDGIELTKRLRAMPDKSPIIIMISVAEWSDIQEAALSAGANGFVPKPLFPSLITDCIARHLGAIACEEAGYESGEERNFTGKTALLAEDVDINREIILTVLDDSGLTIDCAENGRQAIDMFMANPSRYSIILMDVHMPEIDGLEATRRIRALPQGDSVPIVAMTANVFQEDVAMCLEAGMDDHIGKPIDFDQLFAMLSKYID